MRVYFNTDPADLLVNLRYRAIANGASEQIIDGIDRAESELVELRAETAEHFETLEQADNDRDDLYDELNDLIKALDDASLAWEKDKNLKATYALAVAALERHCGK